MGECSFYSPAAIVLEQLHRVTVIFWRSFGWHSRDLCWFLAAETKKFSNCVGHVCSRQSNLPLSVLAAGQTRQDVWTKLFVFSPHAVDGALEVSDWSQFQLCFLDFLFFLGCLLRTLFRWCLSPELKCLCRRTMVPSKNTSHFAEMDTIHESNPILFPISGNYCQNFSASKTTGDTCGNQRGDSNRRGDHRGTWTGNWNGQQVAWWQFLASPGKCWGSPTTWLFEW